MPRLKTGGPGWQGIFMTIIFALVFLYIFSQFIDTSGSVSIEQIKDIDIFFVLKILVIGAFTMGAYALFKKLSGGALTKRDSFTIILLGIGIWFLWDTILQNVLNARSLDDITFSVAKKMGLVP